MKKYMMISYGMLIVGFIFIIIATCLRINDTAAYRIIITLWIGVYLIFTDFIEPMRSKRFENKEKEDMKNYYIYAALDIAGYIGLLVFVLWVAHVRNIVHYLGIVVFIGTIYPKGEYYLKFLKSERNDVDIREIEDEMEETSYEEKEQEEKSCPQEDVQEIKEFVIK